MATMNVLSGRRLLILGGGLFQVPIIKKARSMGAEVVVTDMYPDPPGKAVADHFIQMDIKNFEGNLQVARDYKVEAVVSDQTDVGIPTVAHVSEQLGLKGIGVDIARKFTNKYDMRASLETSGVPMPVYHKVGSLEEAIKRASQVGYPAIIKPPASQSSRGVFKVDSERELREHYHRSLAESNVGYILVEEFINGTEYTVEGFVLNGKATTLAISDKDHLASNPCIATRLTYPPAISQELYDRIASTNNKIVEHLKLPFGITHAEYRVRDGEPYLMEVAARGGGTFISSTIVPACSGWDVNEMLLRNLFSLPVEAIEVQTNSVNLEFMIFPPGQVRLISGIEKARSLPGVLMINLDCQAGDVLAPPTDDRSRHGFMIVTGKSREEVLSISGKVRQAINVEIG